MKLTILISLYFYMLGSASTIHLNRNRTPVCAFELHVVCFANHLVKLNYEMLAKQT